MTKETLGDIYLALINLLDDQNLSYMIIGGLAVGLIGEARVTQDIDIIIALTGDDIDQFLAAAKKCGFTYSSKGKVMEDVKMRGVFVLNKGEFHVDFIIGNMPFEEEAFSRKQKLKLFNRSAFFPTPEDLILFKLIASRPKDLLDLQSIILRHKNKLDQNYLKKWARVISENLDDIQILQRLKELLKQ